MPSRLTRMVGRTDSILMLSSQLTAARFVTIVGAGGVGKTTVAIAVGHDLIEAFAGAVLFVDLGTLNDPRLAAASVASVLGLSVQSADPTPGLIAYLQDQHILLILDNCEHLIEAAAVLAARIFAAAPQVHILATSREPLRVEGEHVYRLAPLSFPTEDAGLTAATALTFPAIQLFAERAAASGAALELNDANAVIVAGICRKLDGIALAIELAAGRVSAYGLAQTATLLEERLSLLWQGQRTAPPRQQTLKATLDWSYELLSDPERLALRRLGVFAGSFSLAAALAVLADSIVDRTGALAALEGLVAKSLVASDGSTPVGRWRLLETIRAYAQQKLGDNGEFQSAARAHAAFFLDFVSSLAPASRSDTTLDGLALCSREIDNVRTALDWALSRMGDSEIGIALTAAYTPVWLHFSWHNECIERTERALQAIGPGSSVATPLRMRLHAGLGMALLHTMGRPEKVKNLLTKALQLAEETDDVDAQLRALWALWILYTDTGNFYSGRTMVERFADIAQRAGDPAVALVADRLSGYTLQFSGDQSEAQRCVSRVLDLYDAPMDQRRRVWFMHDQRIATADLLARTLWLQGFVDQAAKHASVCLEQAVATENSLTICEAIRLATGPIMLATGDLDAAEHAIAILIDHATHHNMTYWWIVGCCLQGDLLIRRGRVGKGVALLSEALTSCERTGWAVCYPAYKGVLADGLLRNGRRAEALTATDLALSAAERGGERWAVPELIRIKGACLLDQEDDRSQQAAEECFHSALEVAKQQSALFWELRIAMDLARLKAKQGRRDAARQILVPTLARFAEGLQTTDIKAAGRLLAALS